MVWDNVVIGVPANQTQFTRRYTWEAIRFNTGHKDTPFFLYLPHNMPHIPLHASADFVGKSQRGIYDLRGRSVQGIRVGDWKYLVDEASEKDAPKVEVELTAEEKKLPRPERKTLIKERSKAASRKPGPSQALR